MATAQIYFRSALAADSFWMDDHSEHIETPPCLGEVPVIIIILMIIVTDSQVR